MIRFLRSRISIEQKQRTADAGGGAAETWQTLATVWAKVMPVSGGEKQQADQKHTTRLYEIVMRYRDDVKASDRLIYRGRILHILALYDPDERRRWLHMQCEEGGAS